MSTKWTIKHEILWQILLLCPLSIVLLLMLVSFFVNHPFWGAAGFIGIFLCGGVFLWKCT